MITGGSGYFGTALNLYLSEKGYEVCSYDAGFFKDNWLGPPVTLNEKWIDARDLTEKEISYYDVVIHFAGISNDPLKQLSEDELHQPSIKYTKDIAEICKKLGKKFIFASSCSVYGFSREIVDETSQPNPLTPYSATKYKIEKLLTALSDENWQPIILRFATIFGFSPRMRFDTVINMFCGMALAQNRILRNSNGLAMRPFISINDASRFIEAFFNHKTQAVSSLNIFNVGINSYNKTINDISEILKQIMPTLKFQFLDSSKNSESVFADRKIVDHKDLRSYEVNFMKLDSLFNHQIKVNSIELEIEKNLKQISSTRLNFKLLNSKIFYRLQYLENLIDINKLNGELRYL